MGNRTLDQWQTIIAQQQASGLTIADFCKQHDINPKSFGSRKTLLKTKGMLPSEQSASGFVRVRHVACNRVVEAITLQAGTATLHLPRTISPQWVAALLKAITP